MDDLSEGMKRVAAVEQRVGIPRLAAEAGLPQSTVRSYRARGWMAPLSIQISEALIAAAERLENVNRAVG